MADETLASDTHNPHARNTAMDVTVISTGTSPDSEREAAANPPGAQAPALNPTADENAHTVNPLGLSASGLARGAAQVAGSSQTSTAGDQNTEAKVVTVEGGDSSQDDVPSLEEQQKAAEAPTDAPPASAQRTVRRGG